MIFKKWKHLNVDKKGMVAGGGQIDLTFSVKNFIENCCNLRCCKCAKGHWISINLGRQKNGTVNGITYLFKTKKEQVQYVASN